jgi:hypothetical protein
MHTDTRHQLPPELIEHIIDYLYWSQKDLQACALVCKAWLPSTRFHLFYKFSCYLGYPKTYPSYSRLYDIIQKLPHISLYFKEFKCYVDLAKGDLPDRYVVKTLLPQLIRSFTNLRMLEIVHWMDFPSEIKKFVLDILDYPSLIHLETDTFYFPTLESFTRLIRPHLKRLDITVSGTKYPLWFDKQSEEESSAVQKRCSLDYLEFSGQKDSFLDWLLEKQAIIDVSHIRILHAHPSPRLFRLVKSVGSSLERLFISGFGHDWSASSIFRYFRTELTVITIFSTKMKISLTTIVFLCQISDFSFLVSRRRPTLNITYCMFCLASWHRACEKCTSNATLIRFVQTC